MIRTILISLFFVTAIVQTGICGQEEKPRVVTLQLDPMPESRPSLKYRLLPNTFSRKPGNAAALYYTAVSLLPDDYDEKYAEKIDVWMKDTAPAELPLDEVGRALDELRNPVHQAELAAERKYCDWELPLEEGINMLMPGLGDFRKITKIIAVRARMEIARGESDKAIATLQGGFSFSRHISVGPTLIQVLVGTAMANLMLNQVEDLIQLPGSPNLYWALSGLDRPFISIRDSMEFEMSWMELAAPELKDLKSKTLSVPQAKELANTITSKLSGLSAETGALGLGQANLFSTMAVLAAYPKAKQYLADCGYSPQRITDTPAAQAVLIYYYDDFANIRDDIFKWFSLPYWQVHGFMQQAERSLDEHMDRSVSPNPFLHLLPALSRAYFVVSGTSRRIAALRCVEAIRLYAAANAGRLPERLEDITCVPIPIDPITGKAFVYTRRGDIGIIDAAAPEDMPARRGFRYEITIKQ